MGVHLGYHPFLVGFHLGQHFFLLFCSWLPAFLWLTFKISTENTVPLLLYPLLCQVCGDAHVIASQPLPSNSHCLQSH
jgi:hypothetical protein